MNRNILLSLVIGLLVVVLIVFGLGVWNAQTKIEQSNQEMRDAIEGKSSYNYDDNNQIWGLKRVK